MDEFAIADINADMAECALQGVEKHPIARLLIEDTAVRQFPDAGPGAGVRLEIGLVRPFNVSGELSTQPERQNQPDPV